MSANQTRLEESVALKFLHEWPEEIEDELGRMEKTTMPTLGDFIDWIMTSSEINENLSIDNTYDKVRQLYQKGNYK